MDVGTLRFVPATEAIELVGGPVREYVQSANPTSRMRFHRELAVTQEKCEK